MSDKGKWLEYRNRISMGLGLEGEETGWVFDKALKAIEQAEKAERLEQENERLKEALNRIISADDDPEGFPDYGVAIMIAETTLAEIEEEKI
jgi:hypothetical protein